MIVMTSDDLIKVALEPDEAFKLFQAQSTNYYRVIVSLSSKS